MRCAKPRKQQGFTLLEIVLSIGLLMLATGLLASAFGPWMAFRQGMETERRLKEIQQALEAAYSANALSVDNVNGEVLPFPRALLQAAQARPLSSCNRWRVTPA